MHGIHTLLVNSSYPYSSTHTPTRVEYFELVVCILLASTGATTQTGSGYHRTLLYGRSIREYSPSLHEKIISSQNQPHHPRTKKTPPTIEEYELRRRRLCRRQEDRLRGRPPDVVNRVPGHGNQGQGGAEPRAHPTQPHHRQRQAAVSLLCFFTRKTADVVPSI